MEPTLNDLHELITYTLHNFREYLIEYLANSETKCVETSASAKIYNLMLMCFIMHSIHIIYKNKDVPKFKIGLVEGWVWYDDADVIELNHSWLLINGYILDLTVTRYQKQAHPSHIHDIRILVLSHPYKTNTHTQIRFVPVDEIEALLKSTYRFNNTTDIINNVLKTSITRFSKHQE